ncbi:major facilitator superfamily transporter [Xylaria bambusicola]|uniref:major facilitator superfamily transporter n=1 Tax=Xylaria bambusicola TaxID=326684 RepID=UPI002007C217|nr:major facilitator superfamily transporter [Xylaria bambusicola]KAI0520684.1 major facilitator superfamily transporter [Xylaria bambusicola]
MTTKQTEQHTADERSHLIASCDSQVTTSEDYQTIGDVESLYGSERNSEHGEERYSRAFVAQVVGALLIGVFTSNVDGSLVLATHPVISSEFHDLEDSSWLFISFWLAGAATQSLYGKICDIYGRRTILVISYGLFAVGCAVIGLGQSMWQIILGRALSGSGQAGMWVLAAVVITDLVPLRDVAPWQSYLNVIATIGRSFGGPFGGWLVDVVGWRWSFLGQVPIFIVATVLCLVVFSRFQPPQQGGDSDNAVPRGNLSQIARIDFVGLITLGLGILSLMLPLEIGGHKIPWSHPTIFILLAIGTLLLGLFVLAETRLAREPIFPLRLLRSRQALLGYLIVGCILAAQSGMVFTIPVYFQVTQRSSSTLVGARLFPAVAGNAIGGILSGHLIRRTGRYKLLAIFASLTSALSYLLMVIRWKGDTSWAESLYIFPGGLGCGIIQSAVFIAIQTSIDPKDKAPGISGFFLATQVGTVIGTSAVSALMIGGLQQSLRARLIAQGLSQPELNEILRQAATSVEYLDKTTRPIARAIEASYVTGLEYGHAFSFGSSIIAFCAALLLRERKLES